MPSSSRRCVTTCVACATGDRLRCRRRSRVMKAKKGDKSIGFIALPEAEPRALSLELSVLPNSGGQYLLLCQPHHGAEGNRTPDLCSAIAALYQLSYSPDSVGARTHPCIGASHSQLKLPTQAHPVNRPGSRRGNSNCNSNICTPDAQQVPSVTHMHRLDSTFTRDQLTLTGRPAQRLRTQPEGEYILYWMQSTQRLQENWALRRRRSRRTGLASRC